MNMRDFGKRMTHEYEDALFQELKSYGIDKDNFFEQRARIQIISYNASSKYPFAFANDILIDGKLAFSIDKLCEILMQNGYNMRADYKIIIRKPIDEKE